MRKSNDIQKEINSDALVSVVSGDSVRRQGGRLHNVNSSGALMSYDSGDSVRRGGEMF